MMSQLILSIPPSTTRLNNIPRSSILAAHDRSAVVGMEPPIEELRKDVSGAAGIGIGSPVLISMNEI